MQLVAMPVAPLIEGRAGPHDPVIVTNGEVEENVRFAIDDFNRTILPRYAGARPVQIWTRGKLLELFGRVAESVWPTDLHTQIALLRSVTADGLDEIPVADLQSVITSVLEWQAPVKPTQPRSKERMAALGLMVGVMSSPQLKIGNLYEVIKVQTLATCALISYMDRFSLRSRFHRSVADLSHQQLLSTLTQYVESICTYHSDGAWINKNVLDEFAIMNPRRMLVTALAAIHMIARSGNVGDQVRGVVMSKIAYPFLASEALIPPFLAVYWAKSAYSGGVQSDFELIAVLHTLTKMSKSGGLASSYFEVSDVIEAQYKRYLGYEWHEIDRDDRRNMSQFIYVVTCMLTKRNWKQTVKRNWPDVTRIIRQQTKVDIRNELWMYRSSSATEESILVEFPLSWPDLVSRAAASVSPNAPEALLKRPPLFLLLLIFLPYRASEDVILWLDRQLNMTWY